MYQPLHTNLSRNVKIRKRGKFKYYLSAIGLCICVVIVCTVKIQMSSENIWRCVLLLIVPCYILSVLIQRLIVSLEELIFQFQARYNRDWKLLLKCCCSDLHSIFVVLIAYVVLVGIACGANFGKLCRREGLHDLFHLLPMLPVIAGTLAFLNILIGYSVPVVNSVLQKTPSMAQIWADAAYTSYYKVVLEDFQKRLVRFENTNFISIPLKQMVLLVPDDCNVSDTFDVYNDDIEYVGDLDHIPNDQGANMNRKYKNPVYRIRSKNQEPLFVALEQPSSVFTFWKMKNVVPTPIIAYQKDIFVSTLEKHLNDHPCVVLPYDGKCPLSRFLRCEISQLLAVDDGTCNIPIG